MKNEILKDWSPMATIKRQQEYIKKLEASRQLWLLAFIGMTVVCIVLTAMKCQN